MAKKQPKPQQPVADTTLILPTATEDGAIQARPVELIGIPKSDEPVEGAVPESSGAVLVEMGDNADHPTDPHQPQTVKQSPGWERVDQQSFDPAFDLEGAKVKDEEGAEYEFKKVVTKQLDGQNIEKVLPMRVADEKTLNMNEDVNIIDDWDERKFIIDKIEGIHIEDEGKSVCIVPGLWDILNNFALGYIKFTDLPDHIGFRNMAMDYVQKFNRKRQFNVEMEFDSKAAIMEWMEACLWHCEIRRRQLPEEAAVGQISQKELLTGMHLIEMAKEAIRKFQEGKIKL